ncbi:MAG: F-actin-capping protein subunit beta [Vezdaea aestivalis]|nr:MAG: F-actin-capping protein subunit beta [Vezdaea aestivalis]
MAATRTVVNYRPLVYWVFRRILFPLSFFAILVLLLNWNSQEPDRHNGLPAMHPIERLYFKAQREFDAKVARQSQTLREATREYKRRYKRNPPAGFQKWFEFARRVNSSVIDDYDTISHDLKPFRSFLRNRCDLDTAQNERLPWLVLTRACIKDGAIYFDGVVHNFVLDPLRAMTLDFVKEIPEMCFEVNYYDEPRIVAEFKDLQNSEKLSFKKQDRCIKQSFGNLDRQDIWSTVTRSCSPASPALERLQSTKLQRDGRPDFVEDVMASTDVCNLESRPDHGFVRSPATAKIGQDLKPVLSPAKLSSFQDILFPSIYRWNSVNDYNETDDIPWADKKNMFYWRGSTTGGMASNEEWEHFHRQKFVDHIRSHKEVGLYSRHEESGRWEPTTGSMRDFEKLIDVNFTAIIQCRQDECVNQREHYGLDYRRPPEHMWKNKLVFDLDGNSYSGRFYDLMRSRSAVLKQALFREWHDERLVPWLHYVPVSMEMTELAEILHFLTGGGDAIAARIATAGREWADKALRREDMQVYLYRLLLEMSRRD